jgi:hypothetical protein
MRLLGSADHVTVGGSGHRWPVIADVADPRETEGLVLLVGRVTGVVGNYLEIPEG